MVKVILHVIRNCSLKTDFAPFGSKFFPLRQVLIMKRDAIEMGHCLIQWSPFDVLRHCIWYNTTGSFVFRCFEANTRVYVS